MLHKWNNLTSRQVKPWYTYGSLEIKKSIFGVRLKCYYAFYLVLSSLHIYTFVVSRAFMAGVASQAGDADSSRAPGLASGLQVSVNVYRGALLLVPQWQCISSFVFFYILGNHKENFCSRYVDLLFNSTWCLKISAAPSSHTAPVRNVWMTAAMHVLALPIEDRERNLTKSILARVCTLNVCGYSTLLRRVQWKVHKNTLLKQDIFLLWGGTNLHECLEWTEICP